MPGQDREAARLVHFLTHHVQPELVVVPVPWLPRRGRAWHLHPELDVVELSFEAWESGRVDEIFEQKGIRIRLPHPNERLPVRVRCPMCEDGDQAARKRPAR